MPPADTSLEIIKSITSANDCPSLLLVSAPDEIRKRRLCDMLLSKVCGGNASALRNIDAKSLNTAQLVTLKDELASQSLFSPFRLFVFRKIDELPAALHEPFIEILEGDLTGVCCLCLSSGLPASSSIFKFFKSRKAAVVLENLEGAELERWIQKELKLQGITKHEPSVVNQLASIGEFSPDTISQIISHLTLFVENESLTCADVRTLFTEALQASEFDLIDALMQRNEARSQSLMSVLLASGKSPFMLIGLLQRNFSTYVAIAGMLKEGRNPGEIGQTLKIQPWLLKKHLAVVQKYPLTQLKRCVESLLRADSKLKNRSLGTESIFSEFVYNVTH